MNKWIATVVAFIAIVGGIWGAGSWFDCRYAKAEDVKVLKQTVQDKLDSDHLRLLRERKWQMEKEYPNPASRTPSVASQIKAYELREKALDQKLGDRVILDVQ
jgi:hypothetical protein